MVETQEQNNVLLDCNRHRKLKLGSKLPNCTLLCEETHLFDDAMTESVIDDCACSPNFMNCASIYSLVLVTPGMPINKLHPSTADGCTLCLHLLAIGSARADHNRDVISFTKCDSVDS